MRQRILGRGYVGGLGIANGEWCVGWEGADDEAEGVVVEALAAEGSEDELAGGGETDVVGVVGVAEPVTGVGIVGIQIIAFYVHEDDLEAVGAVEVVDDEAGDGVAVFGEDYVFIGGDEGFVVGEEEGIDVGDGGVAGPTADLDGETDDAAVLGIEAGVGAATVATDELGFAGVEGDVRREIQFGAEGE